MEQYYININIAHSDDQNAWSWINENSIIIITTKNWKLMQCYSPTERYFNSTLSFAGRGRVSISLVLFSQFDNFSRHRFWRLISVAKNQQLIIHGQYLYTCMTQCYSVPYIVNRQALDECQDNSSFCLHILRPFLILYSGKLSREKAFTNLAIL